jgi:hypothetical protein
MGVVEGNKPAHDNDWQDVTRGGEAAIKRWIDDQMRGRTCMVLLIGAATAGRKWINYEIETAWNTGRGIVGVHIHHLTNLANQQCAKGVNPMWSFTLNEGRTRLTDVVRTYDPPHTDSRAVYRHISEKLAGWVDEACAIRARHS